MFGISLLNSRLLWTERPLWDVLKLRKIKYRNNPLISVMTD